MKALKKILAGTLAVFLTTGIMQVAQAQTDAMEINCSFPVYADPNGLQKAKGGFNLTFLVDRTTGKAVMRGNNGITDVMIIDNENGFSFVEVTKTGNIMTTSLHKNGQAMHSRNSVFTTGLIPSQYYGTCS